MCILWLHNTIFSDTFYSTGIRDNTQDIVEGVFMLEMNLACPEVIKKRNGSPVPFDITKIRAAIRKANDAAQVEAIAPYQF